MLRKDLYYSEVVLLFVIWYNSKKNIYYAKYLRISYMFDHYKVGYKNQYGHIIVCMFYFRDKKLIACNSYEDYFHNKRSLKKILIKRLIAWLERRV